MRPYYEHAGIVIYCGDCREVLPTLEPVDLVVTSPPYPGRRTYGGNVDPWAELVPPALAAVRMTAAGQVLVNLGIVSDGGEIVEYWASLIDAVRGAGAKLAGWYVWDKGWSYPGRFATLGPAHEFVFHFAWAPVEPIRWVRCRQAGKTSMAHDTRNPDDSVGHKSTSYGKPTGERKPLDSVIRVAPVQANGHEHPAVYPVPFARALVESWPGVVLDPFMGSGTTLRAAKDLGRRAIGIEIEERYCEIAAKRMAQETLFPASAEPVAKAVQEGFGWSR